MSGPKPIVMTLMVRDEVDVIAAMIEHHLAQGIDLIIATDNGSVDGTREVLADYAALGVVELHDDPRHEKQQAEVVTRMARRAYVEHGAEWVINADADEFWFASAGGTVAAALRNAPTSIESFDVPVHNLFGRPLESGSAIRSHVWRDERTESELNAVGLHAHPTQDCVHRGNALVEVVQGNHATSLPLTPAADVPESARLEVLHLPYRTWSRYQHRVETTAAAYSVSGRTPSPRHHGMRDARWHERGELDHVFVARHPVIDADDTTSSSGFVHDARLRNELERLLLNGARLPERLSESLADPVWMTDERELRKRFEVVGPWMVEAAEWRANTAYREADFYSAVLKREQADERIEQLDAELAATRAQAASASATVNDLNTYIARLLGNPAIRLTARVLTPRYGWHERKNKFLNVARSVVGRPRALMQRLLRKG